ncbi:N-acetylmuramoyl-L-alanine amidase [Streptomyces sp. H27-C3]|uniref:peptidoglycan recognition protein family protein n=1 Tax=Streptomyces sp. H27-C3 TaxID=3046305 RepID=UPI0024BAD743|nr:N-acetylmuramoyl-L-alanine amidase [Streptomyces sp. H27-C3]MDJ0460573.1 N-acetylmuramoyl-L-alanine amidase [Streptomyces sp. H27-C3]
MAWYPGATKWELQPESDQQAAIRPTQFIVHSIIAPWTARRVYEYWRDSTNLESHFGLGYAGDLGQFVGTETRADANAAANRRPDGTGAVSIETASNLQGSDPWTAQQLERLIALGVWLHRTHGIPLRICRTTSDPGFGYHRLHSAWAVSGTACPGDARVKQFNAVVFPGIVARANGQTIPPQEDDMTPEQAKQLKALYDNQQGAAWRYKGTNEPRDAYDYLRTTARDVTALGKKVDAIKPLDLTNAQLLALAEKIAAHPALAEQIAERVAVKLAARLAN